MNQLLLIFFVLFVSPTPVTEKASWKTDFEEALLEAKTEKKHVLLYFSGSDWCKPCIQMKSYILESEDFQNFANESLVLIQADFPRLKKNRLSEEQIQHNESLAERYNSSGTFPLVVILTTDGQIMRKITYHHQSPEEFISALKGIIQ